MKEKNTIVRFDSLANKTETYVRVSYSSKTIGHVRSDSVCIALIY